MLATMLTVMYFMVRAAEQVGSGWLRPDPLPYMVYQPLPWQVQNVSQNRRGSRVDEREGGSQRDPAPGGHRKVKDAEATCGAALSVPSLRFVSDANSGSGSRQNGQWHAGAPASPEKAAVTIQTQYRKYQQRKQHKDGK
uniref:Secreted protein n=1 Tax=Lepisosteus oculatus TaxID=7918 RepID=W5MI20_LEPOC